MVRVRTGESNPNWKPKIEWSCSECGITRSLVPWVARKRKFCSPACRSKFSSKHHRGASHHLWKGGRATDGADRALVRLPGHPRADARGLVYEHILVVERATGITPKRGQVVHHVTGDKTDNRPSNLVLCEDQGYHLLLHALDRVRRAGGDPLKDRICARCRGVFPETEFYKAMNNRGRRCHCKTCYLATPRNNNQKGDPR